MSESKKPTADAKDKVAPTFSDKPTQDPSEHMVAMGAKKGKATYTAMPPSQHRSFLDLSQNEENRIHAALFERVLVPNPQDWTLAAFAREPNERMTPTGVTDLSNATGIARGNVSMALKRLEARGIIWIQKKPFRIYLCYHVPAPNINPKAKKEQRVVSAQITFNSGELAYLERLQADSPETFRAAMARFVGQKQYDNKRLADSTAWAREREAEDWEQRFMEIGYTEEETRGRKRERPASNPEYFKPAQTFEEFFVQNEAEIVKLAAPLSVQNRKLILHTSEKNSEQNLRPYELTLHSLTEEQLASQGRPNAKTAAREAELRTQAARTEIKTRINAIHKEEGLSKMGSSLLATRTQNNIAGEIVKLASDVPTAENVFIHLIYGLVEDKCSAYKSGKLKADDWDCYLFTVVKLEVAKLLRKIDLQEQINETAREKSAWAKAKRAGA